MGHTFQIGPTISYIEVLLLLLEMVLSLLAISGELVWDWLLLFA